MGSGDLVYLCDYLRVCTEASVQYRGRNFGLIVFRISNVYQKVADIGFNLMHFPDAYVFFDIGLIFKLCLQLRNEVKASGSDKINTKIHKITPKEQIIELMDASKWKIENSPQ